MTIWHDAPSLDSANERGTGCLNELVGIELLEIGDEHLTGRMPVDARTHQPAGVLHGGASVVLAETLASWAATFAVDRSRFHCVGMEINANHLRPVASGWVTGIARPVALGRRTHVWGVEIHNEDGKLVSVSRCTMAVLQTPSTYGA